MPFQDFSGGEIRDQFEDPFGQNLKISSLLEPWPKDADGVEEVVVERYGALPGSLVGEAEVSPAF